MLKDFFKLSFGNLRHRGLRSWLTIIGIFIGIAAVVSLISFGAGLRTAVMGQFGTLSVDTLTIQNKGTGFGPPGSTVVEKLTDKDVRIIEGVTGVDKVISRIIRVGSLEYNGIAGFGYSADIPEDKEDREFVYENLDFKETAEGRFLESGDDGKVLLGNGFLESTDFKKEFSVGKKVKINGYEFEIIGFAEKSSNFQLNNIVFLLTSDMEKVMGIEDEIDMILVQVQDKDRIADVASELERKLRNDRKEDLGEETFTVETPIQALDSVNTILDIINLIVIGIAGISLFVGGVGIANTMYTSVVERTREIGIMKAVGAKNSAITWIFLIEAGLLGLVGGVVGAAIGLSVALGIASVANSALGGALFIVDIDYMLLLGAVGFSFCVGVISGVLPAIQASKLNVVEALRS